MTATEAARELCILAGWPPNARLVLSEESIVKELMIAARNRSPDADLREVKTALNLHFDRRS